MLNARRQDQLADLVRAEASTARQEPENENARALFRAARSQSAVGTPDQVREFASGYEAARQDVMLFLAQAGSRKHEDIMESIDLFGRTVLPEFKERHETIHRPWRGGPTRDVQPSCKLLHLAMPSQNPETIDDEALRALMQEGDRVFEEGDATTPVRLYGNAYLMVLNTFPEVAQALEQVLDNPIVRVGLESGNTRNAPYMWPPWGQT